MYNFTSRIGSFSLSLDSIAKHTIFISCALLVGYFNADIVGLAFLMVIISGFIFGSQDQKLNSVLLAVAWYFMYGFFVGQQTFAIPIVEKVLVKPGFIFFIILIIDIASRYPNYKIDNLIRLHILLFLIIVVSLIVSPNSFSVLLTRHSYVFLYWLLLNITLTRNEPAFLRNAVSLLISLAVVQVVVAYLQVYGLIDPPSIKLNVGGGEVMDWTAGLDDVASGTFGPMQSPDTSWFQTLVFGLCLTYAIINKSYKFLFVGSFVMLQYTLVDSKTMLGVTVIFILLYLLYLLKSNIVKRRRIRFVLGTTVLLVLFSFIFVQLWQNYYQYYDQQVKWNAGFEKVQDYSTTTFKRVIQNIDDWGKIKGFQNVVTVQAEESWIKTLAGFGPGNFLFDTKASKVFALDTSLMQLNNFTRSTSGLIIMFAELGVLGFLIIILIYQNLYRLVKQKGSFLFDFKFKVYSIFLTSFITGSLISAFMYNTLKIHSKSIFGFWFICILFLRIIKFYQATYASEKSTLDHL